MIHNPTSQADIVAAVNEADPPEALAVAFSHYMQDLSEVTDAASQTLKGLFLFGTVKLPKQALLDFVRRTPNLSSLTLASVDYYDAAFLHELFYKGLLGNLKFLEVSHANDVAIGAMVKAPLLSRIVFRWPDPKVSNEGFSRLVEWGGGKELRAIQGGVLKKDMSKTLSVSYLKYTLPKFVAKKANEGNLRNMSAGRAHGMLPTREQDKLPFAVVPVERMTSAMMRERPSRIVV